jgi:outer membrane protein TolC
MKRPVLFLIIFIFASGPVWGAEEISLTLEEAVAIALRDNRDVLLKAEDLRKAQEKVREAQAGLLPTLNFTGSWTETRGLYAKDSSQTATQATLKQYLYKGGKTVNAIRQNKHKEEVSAALLDKVRLETTLSVKKAFYTLILARELASLNKAIADNTQEHLDFTRERYKSGQASESDIRNIEASLSGVQQAYLESLNQAELSLNLLNNLLYLDDDTKIKPKAELNYQPMEVAYDAAFLQAIKSRPEIRQYEAQVQADKKAIEIAKADTRPSIYASWDYYSRSHIAATTSRNWNDYNVIGLTFSWPIFDGWATKAKVGQAIVDLKQTQLLKEKTIKDITRELKDAYLSLNNAIAGIESAEAELGVYGDNLSTVQQKYSQGVASLLDMHDTDLKYSVSAFNKKESVYDYIIAKSDFDKATGGL